MWCTFAGIPLQHLSYEPEEHLFVLAVKVFLCCLSEVSGISSVPVQLPSQDGNAKTNISAHDISHLRQSTGSSLELLRKGGGGFPRKPAICAKWRGAEH